MHQQTTMTATSTKTLQDLMTPAFVINLCAFETNCRRMLDVAKKNNVFIRPHVKTHKTREGCYIQATGRRWSSSMSKGNERDKEETQDCNSNDHVGKILRMIILHAFVTIIENLKDSEHFFNKNFAFLFLQQIL